LFTHNWGFTRAIVDAFNGDGCGVPSVNDALIVLDRDKEADGIEDTPILLNESFEFGIFLGRE
jgi:hypothetical protein